MIAPNLQPQAEKKILSHLIPFMFSIRIEHHVFIFLFMEKKKKTEFKMQVEVLFHCLPFISNRHVF